MFNEFNTLVWQINFLKGERPKMKEIKKGERGISLISLTITIVILVLITNMLVYNAKDSVDIKNLNGMKNDVENLRDKVSEFYNQYGNVPANIPYTNLSSELQQVFNEKEKKNLNEFYVLDLQAMQGLTLNYGNEYEQVKDTNTETANRYTDLYIIHRTTHNIFLVKGIKVKENNETKTYYTDYTTPDNSTINFRYVDGIKIPDGYFYLGQNDEQKIVISPVQEEAIQPNQENQYTWEIADKVPEGFPLQSGQTEEEFAKSIESYQGYYLNGTKTKAIYLPNDETKWSSIYTKNANYTDLNGDTAYIPKGFQVSLSPSMNTINRGLVIRDESQNEYVWIPVPENILNGAKEAKDIEIELKKYIGEEHSSDDEDVWYDATGKTEGEEGVNVNDSTGCGLTLQEYKDLKDNMLLSIKQHHGFYIGRYEAGIDGNTQRTALNSSATKPIDSIINESGLPVSKPDKFTYNYVTCSQAQKLTSQLDEGKDYTTSVMFSIQWNLVCKWLEESKSKTVQEIYSNSSSWGNYNNATYTITKGKYSSNEGNTYTSVNGSYLKQNANSILFTTGITQRNSSANIYDLAGNVWEWTLGKNSENSSPCSCRGGNCNNFGYDNPVNYRSNGTIAYNHYNVGFRIVIY